MKKIPIASPVSSDASPGARSHYDSSQIIALLRKLIGSRPPEGSIRWTLTDLAAAVRSQVPGAGRISSEYVRRLMVHQLGIRSVRNIEPYWLQRVRAARHRKHGLPIKQAS